MYSRRFILITETLLPTTSTIEKVDIQGEPIKAAGWYGISSGLHTVAVYVQNFTGRIFIEGTLSDNPYDAIWFNIDPGTGVGYLQFPIIPSAPSSIRGGDNGVQGFTFKANALWIRARVERSYFLPNRDLNETEMVSLGAIRKILVSM